MRAAEDGTVEPPAGLDVNESGNVGGFGGMPMLN